MVKKYTQQEYLDLARSVHGTKYDLSDVLYERSSSKVLVGCKTHGKFLISATSFLQGCGCKKCALEYTASRKRKTTTAFVSELSALLGHNYSFDKVDYKNNKAKVVVTCKIHGDFEATPHNLLNGTVCPKCAVYGKKKMSQEEYISKATEVHGETYDLSEVFYRGSSESVDILCKKHNEIFKTVANEFLRGSGCPKCAIDKLRIGVEEFIKRSKLQHGERYIYRCHDFVDLKTPTTIACRVHGDFKQISGNHMRGDNCPLCAKVTQARHQTYTNETYVLKLRSLYGEKYSYSLVNYKGARSTVLIECPEHGVFSQTAFRVLQGVACPACKALEKNGHVSLYVLDVEGRAGEFTGFGITKNISSRLNTHKRNLRDSGFKVLSSTVFEFNDSFTARAIETCLKRTFNKSKLSSEITGFKTESTCTRLTEVLDFINKNYDKEGGRWPLLT